MALDVVASVLAHQGGWDEILFVLAPLAILAALLLMARRRLDEDEADRSAPEAERPPADAGRPEGPGPA